MSAPLEKYGGGEDGLHYYARNVGLPILTAGELRASTLPRDTDLIVCAHSHDFIGRKTRHALRIGAIGYHPSLLPLHRGRDAVKWTVRNGDRVTGGSVYWLNDTVDGGPVAAQDFCLVRPNDDARKLWQRELLPMGVRLVMQTLADIESGVIIRVPQDEALATWEPSLDAAPLHRPELPELPAPGVASEFKVVTARHESWGMFAYGHMNNNGSN